MVDVGLMRNFRSSSWRIELGIHGWTFDSIIFCDVETNFLTIICLSCTVILQWTNLFAVISLSR